MKISQIAALNVPSMKLQFKACEVNVDNIPTLTMCILKWGGELTPAGSQQCATYAPLFSNALINTDRKNQLNFLKNMKVFVTDEVRVRKTAEVIILHHSYSYFSFIFFMCKGIYQTFVECETIASKHTC